jgi:hypothetical protein
MQQRTWAFVLVGLVGCASPSGAPTDGGEVDGGHDGAMIDASDANIDGGMGPTAWTKTLGGLAFAGATDIAVLSDGSVVVAGGAYNAFDLGGGVVGEMGDEMIWIARFSATGEHIWSRTFATKLASIVRLAVADDDTIYVGSHTASQTLDVGTGPLAKIGTRDLLIVKVASAGTVSAAIRRGGAGGVVALRDIAIDGQRVIATGSFDTHEAFPPKSINLGAGALVGTGALADAWVAAYDTNLVATWSKKLGAPPEFERVISQRIAIDPITHAATVCGTFDTPTNFGGGTRTPTGNATYQPDVFLVTLAGATGIYVNDITFGTPDYDSCDAIEIDAAGGVRVAGSFDSGTLSLGGRTATAVGEKDAFVARLVNGSADYLVSFGTPAKETLARVATGSGVISGSFQGPVQIGGMSLTTTATRGAVLAQLDASGTATWAISFGVEGATDITAVAEVPGAVYVVGSFHGAVIVEGVRHESVGASSNDDVLIARIPR